MNLDRTEAILKLLQQQDYVGEITAEGEGWRLVARKARHLPPPPPELPTVPIDEAPAPVRHSVRAGLVGIYQSPEPPLERAAFVAQGTALGSIDSMRILNPVIAEQEGYVLDIMVEDGDPVEYGQELYVLSPERPAEA